MSRKIYFLRHASTHIEPTIHPRKWDLSKEGIHTSQLIRNHPIFSTIDHIFCSTEQKTYLTIAPYAQIRSLPVHFDAGFGEIHASDLPLTTKTQFETMKHHCFLHLDKSPEGAETFREGLTRFKLALSKVQTQFPSGDILIVSHGTILTLYFADLLQLLEKGEETFFRWQNLPFGALGVTRDGVVIQDLTSLN